MKIEENEVYTTKEVAELLKVSLPTVKRMLKDKRLKSTRVGKQHRFLGRDLLDMLSIQERAKKPEPEAAPKPEPATPAKPPELPKKEAPAEAVSTAEMRQRAYMIGKTLLRDMFDDDGNLLFEQGCVITEEMIETAKRKRKLMELFSNLEHED